MSFLRGTEEYYRKFIELQEKLRKSEEERLKLEMKFNEMIQVTKEEDVAHHRRVQSQYKDFLQEDNKRQERNDRIIKVLERIENRAAVLAAKTEKFQLFRKQYMSYLRKVSYDVPYSHSHDNASIRSVSSMHSINDLKPNTPVDFEQKYSNISEKRHFKPVVLENRPTTSENKSYSVHDSTIYNNGDLYNHPIVRKALEQTNRNLNSDLEALKRYLSNRSPIEVLKPSSVLDDLCLSDSSDSVENDIHYDHFDVYKPRSEKVEDNIAKAMRWRPKFQMPRRQRFQFRSRNKWVIPEKNKYVPNGHTNRSTRTEYLPRSFCGTKTFTPNVPRRQDVEIIEPHSFRYQTPSYTDYGKRTDYRPMSNNTFKDDDIDFLTHQNLEYQASGYSRYKPSVSPRNDLTQDLSYQLSNYPNLDHKNRLNIEYTVYPKISDMPPAQHSTSSYEPVNYNYKPDASPSRSHVTWYDHYLGRCQPSDNYPYESPPNDNNSKEYKSKYVANYDESKTQQDNILLNPEKRNVEVRSRTPSPYNTPYVPEKQNGIIKNKEFASEPKKEDQIDYGAIYREDLPTSPVASFQNINDHEELSKNDGDVPEYDSTEDQVLSEVLQDDIIETPVKSVHDFEDHYSDYRLKDEKYPECEEQPVEQEETNEHEYYEEKHDSLQEIQKESLQDADIDREPTLEDQENLYKEHAIQNKMVHGTSLQPQENDVNKYEQSEKERSYQEPEEQEISEENLKQNLSKIQLNGDQGIKDAFKVMHTDADSKESKSNNVSQEENKQHAETPSLNNSEGHEHDFTKGNLKYVEADEPEQEPSVVNGTSNVEQPTPENSADIKESTTAEEQQSTVLKEKADLSSQEQSTIPQTSAIYPNVETNQTYDTNAENAQYAEGAEGQYDQNGQMYDENAEQQHIQYDENGQPIQYDNIQYDENGQPIGYSDGQYYAQYDDNGQLIPQYDEHGQPIQQYDENGQPIQQYDENGQPVLQYDENGQPIMQYDENGQPVMMYDDNGQPLYQYDQYYQDQQYQDQQYQDQQYQETQQVDPQQQQQYVESQPDGQPEVSEVAKDQTESSPEKAVVQETDKTMKVVDMLDTDTESSKQEAKISNESDFDLSSANK